jgi:hypothetical protein
MKIVKINFTGLAKIFFVIPLGDERFWVFRKHMVQVDIAKRKHLFRKT